MGILKASPRLQVTTPVHVAGLLPAQISSSSNIVYACELGYVWGGSAPLG